MTPRLFWHRAFSRTVGLVTPHELEKLRRSRVAIPGLGGVGGQHLLTFARSGFGKFNIADFDTFELENFNRQAGATMSSVGRLKLDVMREAALEINPFLEISSFPEGVTAENVDRFLDGVDIVVDSLDFFALDARRILFRKAWEKNIPVITAGPIGFSTIYLSFIPGEGIDLEHWLALEDGETKLAQLLKFFLATRPTMNSFRYVEPGSINFDECYGPSFIGACQLCAGVAVTEALKLVLKRGRVWPVPYYQEYDPYLGAHVRGRLPGGNRHPLQRIKLFLARRSLERAGAVRRLRPPAAKIENGHIPIEVIEYIARAGTLSPSGDNAQQWQLRWDGSALSLFCDWDRAAGGGYDSLGVATAVAFGTLVENIRIAASWYGLKTRFTLTDVSVGEPEIGKITFESGLSDADPLAPSLTRRHTNRQKFKRRGVEMTTLDEIRSLVGETPGHDLKIVSDYRRREQLAEFCSQGDRILWETEMLHAELFRWIRTKGTGRNTTDGLTLGTLGLQAYERMQLPLLASFQFVRTMNRFGLSKIFARRTRKLMHGSPVHAVFFADLDSPEDVIRAGREVERFWIAANAVGLSVQPMNAAIFAVAMLGTEQEKKLSSSNLAAVHGLKSKITGIFPEEGKSPVMLLRVGYAAPPKDISGRLPLEAVFRVTEAEALEAAFIPPSTWNASSEYQVPFPSGS